MIQSDGKIVVSGATIATHGTDYMVARYLPNGAIDTSFAGDGIAVLDPYEVARAAVALQPDGRIVVAETLGHRSTTGMVVRLNAADGSRDSGFGDGGQRTLDLSDPSVGFARSTVLTGIAVQPNGAIVLAGRADIVVNGVPTTQAVAAQLTPKGMLDHNFGAAGRTFTGLGLGSGTFLALTLQPDGRIVAVGLAGSNRLMAFARFDPEGLIDNSFSGDGSLWIGYSSTTVGAAIALQSDGKIVAAGGDSEGSAAALPAPM